MAISICEGKRTQALRGRNLLGILSPKRPSDVEGRRDEPFMAAVAPLCFFCRLIKPAATTKGSCRCDPACLAAPLQLAVSPFIYKKCPN